MSASATKVFAVDELVRELVALLPRADLARLARTTKLFHEAALDELWKEFPGFRELLACIPAYRLDDVDGTESLTTLRRPSPSDWDRAAGYCSRVRKLEPPHIVWFARRKFESQLQATLLPWVPDMFLFPRLEELAWEPDQDSGDMAAMLRFLPPTLKILRLEGNLVQLLSYLTRNEDLISRLSSIHLKERFRAHSDNDDEDDDEDADDLLGRQLVRLLRARPHLQQISLDGLWISHVTVAAFASHPTLRELELDLDLEAIPKDVVRNPGFLTLESIKMVMDGNVAAPFIPWISQSPLRKFTFRTPEVGAATTKRVSKLAAALHTHAPLTLESIAMYWDDVEMSDSELVIEPRTLRSLLRFVNLTTLELSALRFNIGDKDLTDLASHLPKLQHLELHFYPADPEPHRAFLSVLHDGGAFTQSTLVSLAKMCPLLETLELTVDTSAVVADDSQLSDLRQISHRRLRSFNFGYSYVTNAAAVAQFLVALFPRVEVCGDEEASVRLAEVTEAEEDLGELMVRWEELERLVPQLVRMRRMIEDECGVQTNINC